MVIFSILFVTMLSNILNIINCLLAGNKYCQASQNVLFHFWGT